MRRRARFDASLAELAERLEAGARRGRGDDEDERRGRPAAADLHLLPSGAAAGRAGRADAARGLRPHHRGDRARLPRPRRRRWRSASSAPRPRSATRAFPTRCRRRAELPERLDSGAARRLSGLQRGLLGLVGRLADAARSLGRGDPAGPAAGRAAARAGGDRAARADAAARVAARGADVAPTASWSCSTTRTARAGTATQIAEGTALVERALASRRFGPVHAAGGDRGGPRRGARRRPRPTGRRSSGSTTCCCGPIRRRWSS